MTDYKPGTVAVATVRGVENIRVVRIGPDSHDAWYVPVSTPGTHLGYYTAADVTDVRPLVVLDLKDAPHAEDRHMFADWLRRIAEGDDPSFGTRPRGAVTRWIAEQIDRQTRPKPAEPTGLGAVVEDAEGCRWVRKGTTAHGEDWSYQIGDAWTGNPWSRIDAVRVLSEGITA